MDRPTLSSNLKLDRSPSHPRPLSSPDPEARGRSKRRRDPLSSFSSLNRGRARGPPSGESSTLRGRCRYRSPSRMSLVVSRASTAAPPRDIRELSPPSSPEKCRLVGLLVIRPENHRRSQSPSRSRSPARRGGGAAAGKGKTELVSVVVGQRRRHRTQSRSRRYGLDEAFPSGGQAGSCHLGLEGWATDRAAGDQD